MPIDRYQSNDDAQNACPGKNAENQESDCGVHVMGVNLRAIGNAVRVGQCAHIRGGSKNDSEARARETDAPGCKA